MGHDREYLASKMESFGYVTSATFESALYEKDASSRNRENEPALRPQPLDLVRHLGVRMIFHSHRRVPEIELQAIGKPLEQPGGLSRSPETEQDEARAWGGGGISNPE